MLDKKSTIPYNYSKSLLIPLLQFLIYLKQDNYLGKDSFVMEPNMQSKLEMIKAKMKAKKESALINQFNKPPPEVSYKPIEKINLQIDFDVLAELELDLENLEEENRTQAKLSGKIGRIISLKYEVAERLELELVILKQKLGESMVLDPEAWGLKKGEKLTGELITRTAHKSSQFIEKNLELIRAKSELKDWEGMFESCKQKSTSISRAWKEQE